MNITTLCLAITTVADERCQSLLDQARETADKFKTALTLFSQCHTAYNSQTYLTDDDLRHVGMYISQADYETLRWYKLIQI